MLKTYSLRLDEKEFEALKKALVEIGDPDLNIGFVLRSYIRYLNRTLSSHRPESSLEFILKLLCRNS